VTTHPTTLALLAVVLAACASDPPEPAREDAGAPDAGTPDAGPEQCEYFALAFVPSTAMRPGRPCLDCHDEDDDIAPLTLAGTVFDDRHAEDDCRGVRSVQVIVTGADGTEHRLLTEVAGNFMTTADVAFPASARVVDDSAERSMLGPVEHGNCNACHTSEGAMDAPGRIVAPSFVP